MSVLKSHQSGGLWLGLPWCCKALLLLVTFQVFSGASAVVAILLKVNDHDFDNMQMPTVCVACAKRYRKPLCNPNRQLLHLQGCSLSAASRPLQDACCSSDQYQVLVSLLVTQLCFGAVIIQGLLADCPASQLWSGAAFSCLSGLMWLLFVVGPAATMHPSPYDTGSANIPHPSAQNQ